MPASTLPRTTVAIAVKFLPDEYSTINVALLIEQRRQDAGA